MERVRGVLFRGTKEVATGLEIRLNTVQSPAGREWHGTFRLPPDSQLERGTYVLRLADGRTGNIRVTFTSVFCDRTLAAQFVGTEMPGG